MSVTEIYLRINFDRFLFSGTFKIVKKRLKPKIISPLLLFKHIPESFYVLDVSLMNNPTQINT